MRGYAKFAFFALYSVSMPRPFGVYVLARQGAPSRPRRLPVVSDPPGHETLTLG